MRRRVASSSASSAARVSAYSVSPLAEGATCAERIDALAARQIRAVAVRALVAAQRREPVLVGGIRGEKLEVTEAIRERDLSRCGRRQPSRSSDVRVLRATTRPALIT